MGPSLRNLKGHGSTFQPLGFRGQVSVIKNSCCISMRYQMKFSSDLCEVQQLPAYLASRKGD